MAIGKVAPRFYLHGNRKRKNLADYGIRDQMRRAAVSICSNIAEGDERDSDRDSTRFFCFAKGSLAELVTQLEIAMEIDYITSEGMKEIRKECEEIGGMPGALIRARRNG